MTIEWMVIDEDDGCIKKRAEDIRAKLPIIFSQEDRMLTFSFYKSLLESMGGSSYDQIVEKIIPAVEYLQEQGVLRREDKIMCWNLNLMEDVKKAEEVLPKIYGKNQWLSVSKVYRGLADVINYGSGRVNSAIRHLMLENILTYKSRKMRYEDTNQSRKRVERFPATNDASPSDIYSQNHA